jgi:hypothetical protein
VAQLKWTAGKRERFFLLLTAAVWLIGLRSISRIADVSSLRIQRWASAAAVTGVVIET